MESRRQVGNKVRAPTHAPMFHLGKSNTVLFGCALLKSDVVVAWILNFGDINL